MRPGGPLSAFRVGAVPYALLPATSVARLAGATPGPLSTALASLQPTLLTASTQAARVDPNSADPDGDLVNVLRLNPSSPSFLVQVLIGSDFQVLIAQLPGATTGGAGTAAASGWIGEHPAAQRRCALLVSGTPRIALGVVRADGLVFGNPGFQPWRIASHRFPIPRTISNGLPVSLLQGGAELAARLSSWLRTSARWLYQLLRHSVLLEKARTARPNLREVEVLGLESSETHAAATPKSSDDPRDASGSGRQYWH